MSEKSVISFDSEVLAKKNDANTPEALFQELISRVQKYHPSDDISQISKAYRAAEQAHKDQVRKSGEPYIIHP